MRTFLSISIISILVLSGLGAVALSDEKNEINIKETIIFSQPRIIEQEKYITIESSEATSEIMSGGKPLIPTFTKVYTLPFGSKVKNVQVTFSETLKQKISKPILPAPEPQIVSTVYSSSYTSQMDESIYSDIKIYPEKRFSYTTGAGLSDETHVIYLSVRVNLIQYVPSENIIYYSNSAMIDVTYSPPERSINYPNEYDLLIITPAEFTTQLQELVDYKNNNNITTKMVTLEEIPNTGADQQESIKYYIKYAIENWGITYLILVGSGLPEQEKFPVRYAWIPSGNYEDNFPSDLYYADIYDGNGNFSTWDKDGDGKYAEFYGSNNDMPVVDMYPDVYLGKLPCNTALEVQTMVKKIIYYHEHNKMLNNILQMGGDTFPGDDEEINEGEYCNQAVLSNLPGYSTTQLWASNGKLTKENIANGIKNNVDLVDFSGHGSHLSWATHATNDDEVWIPPKTVISPYTGFLYVDIDLYNVNNAYKYPVVVFNACSCNKYTSSDDCIGWKILKKPNGGSIATFAASGIGYGSPGSYETQRLWGWAEVHIFKEIYQNKILGKVWGNVINGYINTFISDDWDDADYKTVLELSMFGDPTVAIQNGKDPKSISVNKPIINNILGKLADDFPILQKLLKLFSRIY